MKKHLLSIIIPVYNEKNTIKKVIAEVDKAPLPKGVSKELIIVDDGSKDGTRDILATLPKKYRVILHKKNTGKGGAVKTGIKYAKGDIIIIQDADMEYDPKDHAACIQPILDKKAKVVYGSRRLCKSNKQYNGISFYLGGILVTWATNILYLTHITDEPTCYKTFHKDIIKPMKINGNRFEWEPEVTAKILKQGIKIHEVPIKYFPRSAKEGKKIKWRDGVDALWTLLKYRFVN